MSRVHRRHTDRAEAAPLILDPTHPAVTAGVPLFPSEVYSARDVDRCLIPAENNSKIGSHWTKVWRDAPIYTLTLAERVTCPRTCSQWASCMGNHMPRAWRIAYDDLLLPRLEEEIWNLAAMHNAFAVRLHTLGDFVDPAYTRFWLEQVRKTPELRCFGFTANPREDEIGQLIEGAGWDRFRIRFSNQTGPRSSRVMIDAPRGRHPDGAVTCPVESGDADTCGACGLCLLEAVNTIVDPICGPFSSYFVGAKLILPSPEPLFHLRFRRHKGRRLSTSALNSCSGTAECPCTPRRAMFCEQTTCFAISAAVFSPSMGRSKMTFACRSVTRL